MITSSSSTVLTVWCSVSENILLGMNCEHYKPHMKLKANKKLYYTSTVMCSMNSYKLSSFFCICHYSLVRGYQCLLSQELKYGQFLNVCYCHIIK